MSEWECVLKAFCFGTNSSPSGSALWSHDRWGRADQEGIVTLTRMHKPMHTYKYTHTETHSCNNFVCLFSCNLQVKLETQPGIFLLFTVPSESIHSPWLIPHFVVTAWIQNVLNILFFSPIYTQYPIMTKWKHVLTNVCRFIENEMLKYLLYVSIRTPVITAVSLSILYRFPSFHSFS